MTDDSRNSLTAVVSVSVLIAVFWLFLSLTRAVELPSWTPYAALGISLLNLVIGLGRWRRHRLKRKQA